MSARHDYFKKPQPTIGKAQHKVLFKEPPKQAAPKPGHGKGANASTVVSDSLYSSQQGQQL
ncbi:MAG: hypothetical protein ABI990_01620 [Actinomycetota bacterium]